MRKLFLIFVFCFSTSVFAEVFYCYEEDSIGFDKDKNSTKEEFILENFTFDIDFENETVFSLSEQHKYLGFVETVDTECSVYKNEEMYCINVIGTAFSFNKNTLKFKIAKIFNSKKDSDDDSISYGVCSLIPKKEFANLIIN